jgi:hypothetical protein
MSWKSWILKVCPNSTRNYSRVVVATIKHLSDINMWYRQYDDAYRFLWCDVIDYKGFFWLALQTDGTPEVIMNLTEQLDWTSLNDPPLISSHRWYRRIQNARYLRFDFEAALDQEEEELRLLRESESQD